MTPRPDHGLTHVALQVSRLERSLDFYLRYADMSPVHRRTTSEGVRVAWITDHTRPFVIVLLETTVTHPVGGWNHIGIGVATREEVDRRIAAAVAEGFVTAGPHDSGPPAGYYGIVVDPDGHNLEIAFGQEVTFTVEHPGSDPLRP
ncbi:MAG: VOC family protein [Actinobacteria bacterium]|nr:VOC family protein [Actinomycetota bacterium]